MEQHGAVSMARHSGTNTRAVAVLVSVVALYTLVALLLLPSISKDVETELSGANIVTWLRNGKAGHAPENLLFLFADNSYFSYIQNYMCSLQRALKGNRDFGASSVGSGYRAFADTLAGVVIVTWEPVLIENISAWLADQALDFQVGALKPGAWGELGMEIVDASDAKIRPVGSERYKELIKRKIPMIRMLLDHFSAFIFSDADIAWRDDSLLQLLPRASECDMLFMSDARDKLTLCQILEQTSHRLDREPNRRQLGPEGKPLLHPTLSCSDKSAWKSYPSGKVYQATKQHDKTHPTAEDVAQSRRGGTQGYAKLNMGFVVARSTERTKSLLDQFIAADRKYDFREEQDAVYQVLAGDVDAPEHRFLDPLDDTAADLEDHVMRLCILPPEQYPNGFLATRHPWSLDYATAFGRDFGEGIPMNATCPCSLTTQYTAIFAMEPKHHTNALIHFNGLMPKQKIAATMSTGLWFLHEDNVCSASPVTWDESIYEWTPDVADTLKRMVRGEYGVPPL